MARAEAVFERLLLVSEGTATAPAVSAAQDRSDALIAGLVARRNCSARVVSSPPLSGATSSGTPCLADQTREDMGQRLAARVRGFSPGPMQGGHV